MRYLLILIFPLIIFATDGFAQSNDSCKALKYENNNQITPNRLTIKNIEGRVSIPDLDGSIGLFGEETQKLIAVTSIGRDGRFKFRNISEGKYRIVVRHAYNAFCVANISIEVLKKSKEKRKIFVHLIPGAIDTCSFGELK